MNPDVIFCGIDRSPWLSLKQVGVYLGGREVQAAREFVKENERRLRISRNGPGGRIMVKLAGIERIMNAG